MFPFPNHINWLIRFIILGGNCEEGEECDNILDELENIDDELDETGIIFVTTEDISLAKKYGIKTFPTLVFFRNKDPLVYKGKFLHIKKMGMWIFLLPNKYFL